MDTAQLCDIDIATQWTIVSIGVKLYYIVWLAALRV